MDYKRYFLIEPNLKKPYGHVIEFPFVLQDFLKKHNTELYVICNKDIDKNLLGSLEDTHPFITQGCFDDLYDEGNTYKNDLIELNEKFKFTDKDLLINLTSYTNQILGVAKYLKQNNINQPTFCLWFHQIYPPTKAFSETLSFAFQKQAYKNLSNAFNSIKGTNNVFIFTTSSEGLHDAYEDFSKRNVGKLPLPYSKINKYSKPISNKKFTLGFLGDGRYEKGLLLILEHISKSKDYSNSYILENIFPRGYSDSDLAKLDTLESEINISHINVKFIKKPFSNQEYKNVFKQIDAFLMPYHPKSYDKRVSGIFIEATMNEKPVIASSDTWMAEQIEKYGNGATFDYRLGIKGLNNAIEKITLSINKFKENSIIASRQYNQIHSPDNFIKFLLKSIT